MTSQAEKDAQDEALFQATLPAYGMVGLVEIRAYRLAVERAERERVLDAILTVGTERRPAANPANEDVVVDLLDLLELVARLRG